MLFLLQIRSYIIATKHFQKYCLLIFRHIVDIILADNMEIVNI